MIRDIKQLKKKYDKEKIQDFVKAMRGIYDEMLSQGRELVERLWYLEKTARFRELPGYEQSTFKDFLYEMSPIPYHRYNELRYAFHWFPKEADKYGPQTIQKIKAKVGVVKLPEVLRQIDNAMERMKIKGNKRETIHQVIDRYAPPEKAEQKPDSKAYWKARARELKERNQALIAENRDLKALIEKLKEQIERQKGPIEAFSAIRNLMEPLVQARA